MEERGRASILGRRAEGKRPPLCPHFGPCGGCSALDWAYRDQLGEKKAAVGRAFALYPRLACVEIPSFLPDPFPYYYRNKAIYPFGLRRGETVAGFYRRASHAIVDVRTCQIQDPSLTEMANRIRRIVSQERVSIYDEASGRGLLRGVFLRVGVATGEIMVALLTRPGLFPAGPRLAALLARTGEGLRTRHGKAAKVVSVMRNIAEGRTNVLIGPKSLPLVGRDFLMDRLGKLRLRVSLPSFYQVNPSQTQSAYRLAVDLAGDAGRGKVVDAFCGIGSAALWFARGAQEVIGLEEVPEAVRDAAWNARTNGFENCRFLAGTVEELLAREGEGASLVVLDPPRKGCAREVLEALARIRPLRTVYISCSPKTLARDLDLLLGKGFRLDAVRPVDLFPHTEHVEVVCSLSID